MRSHLSLTTEGERVYAELRRIAIDFCREQLADLDRKSVREATAALQNLLQTLTGFQR